MIKWRFWGFKGARGERKDQGEGQRRSGIFFLSFFLSFFDFFLVGVFSSMCIPISQFSVIR